MPFYEYRCDDCQMVTDGMAPISESDKPQVFKCGRDPEKKCLLRRIMSATRTTFVFADHPGYSGLDNAKRKGPNTMKQPKEGDTVEVRVDFPVEKTVRGTVIDLLSSQFTYRDEDNIIRYCLYKGVWKIVT